MKIDVYVETRPVSVEYECPLCESDISVDYKGFKYEHGDSCDWEGEKIVCPKCGAILEIDYVEWR